MAPDTLLIAPPGVEAVSTPAPRARWLKPSLARELETLIADLASNDPQRHENVRRRLKEPDDGRGLDLQTVLDGLAAASWALDGEALRRCQRLRREIAESHQLWYSDIPSGADAQALTPAQQALLDARIALPASEPSTIEALLKRDGVRFWFHAPSTRAYRGVGKAPTRRALLKTALRAEGLDFYLDGNAIIVDTAERVRAAVEK
jgi:hypothetical protein